MLSIPPSLRLTGRYDNSHVTWRSLASSRAVRSVAIALCASFLLLGAVIYGVRTERVSVPQSFKTHSTKLDGAAEDVVLDTVTGALNPALKGRLHLLVPATSSNPDFCKLLVSTQILEYPTPVLINFGDREDAEQYVQHLAKVEGILNYLDALVAQESHFDEDLVLIVDGFDVWFQLRRDVLLQRYYALNAAADERTVNQYGEELFLKHDMRQTVVFGPDKICWPIDHARPACWAVPETTLGKYAFGPQTSKGRQELNQPRWLNSGTILGPAQDLQALFRATLEEIHSNHTTDSDQFYLAEIFGRQEYARLQRKPQYMEHMKSLRFADEIDMPEYNITRSPPNRPAINRTEYHIGIDYESTMFQTLAFWKQFLTWMRPVDSWPQSSNGSLTASRYEQPLPDDIASSEAPYNGLRTESETPLGVDTTRGWTDVELLYNTVTRVAPALIHFTGEKKFRQIWWQKLWFQATAWPLRLAGIRAQMERQGHEPEQVIGGYRWYNAEPPEADKIELRGMDGAWADTEGGWFSWRGLCEAFEFGMFWKPGEDFFHRTPTKPEEQNEEGGEDDVEVEVVVMEAEAQGDGVGKR